MMRPAVLDRTRNHFHIPAGGSLVSTYVVDQKIVNPTNSRALRSDRIFVAASNRLANFWKKSD